MKLTFLTPGTGHSYCENCLHDNMLARELIRQGHDARMYPLYLPLVTETPDVSAKQPMQLGGINMFMADQSGFWKKLPYWLTRSLDSRSMLKLASKRMGMTSPSDLGKATVAMLSRSEQAPTPDLQRLIAMIAKEGPGDAIILSNIMLSGIASHLKSAFHCPIVCQMQGEDQFLDALAEPWSSEAWSRLEQEMKQVDRYIAPSKSYASTLADRLNIPLEDIHIVPSTIDITGYPSSASLPDLPTVCFMSRLAPEKGIEELLRAFSDALKKTQQPARLILAGSLAAHEKTFLKSMRELACQLGLQDVLTIETDVSRERKIEILSQSTVLSVPLRYPDAFGLFIPEAWAAGTPVLLPSSGASIELLTSNPAGSLYDKPKDLAMGLAAYLGDPERALAEGQMGMTYAHKLMNIEKGAQDFLHSLPSI